ERSCASSRCPSPVSLTALCDVAASCTIRDRSIRAMHNRMTQPSLESFDWRLVRSFLAVLDAGSLTGAARQLRAQQPTLSRHVAELEAQLGAPLFERTGRGVTPTTTALAIADAARQMKTGAEALAHTLAGRRGEAGGTVRITASMVAAA